MFNIIVYTNNMEQILCHLEHDFGMRGKPNQRGVSSYSVQHAETMPCGNTMHKRHCFSMRVVCRM